MDTDGQRTAEPSAPRHRYKLCKSVVLVGMMGSGKTAVGRTLAARLDVPMRDSDHAIEEAAARTIAEIFARDGEAFFREKEAQIITRLMAVEPPGILSTGGGAFLCPANRATIAAAGVSVWLDAPLALLWTRVRHNDTRPLLRTADPFATLSQIYADRAPIYALADLRVPVDPPVSLDAMADRVLRMLAAARPDVLEVIA